MDKNKRREKRKAKKASQEKARQSRTRRILSSEEIKPISLPDGINIYDYLKEMVNQGRTTDAALQGIDLPAYLRNIDRTLEHFKVELDRRSHVGDILFRFAMLYAEQDDGKIISIPADDPALNALADYYEYFNKLDWGTTLTESAF